MKSIFEQLGGTYHEENGYLIPDLRLPAEEEQSIGTLGQRHLDYLKQYQKVTCTNLLTSVRLNAYLADIDKQAQERFERLIEGMKQAQGITEQLKPENQLEWVQRVNDIRACAGDIVNEEIIYAWTTWRQRVKALSLFFIILRIVFSKTVNGYIIYLY